jgi:hypothetical protein
MVMSNLNDKKIMELKKQIAEKKVKLEGINRFVPITNCSIELDGQRYNLQVLQKDQIVELMVRVNLYLMSAKDLELLEIYTISGYKPEDWIIDLKARLDILSKKDEERKLKAMEEKLDRLLSDEKKTELELDEIESLLKNKL